tara:strand:+ start:356 stop:538 length:183 start_codon:yes stop_codon:yes gene_type:complete
MYYIQIRTAYGWHRYGADNYSSLLVAALRVQMHVDDATEWGLIRTRGIFRIVKVKPKSKL